MSHRYQEYIQTVSDSQEAPQSGQSSPDPCHDIPSGNGRQRGDSMDDEPIRVILRRIEKKLDTLLRVIGKTKPGRPSPTTKG